ncbi:unnamed protein product [Owenia fusiformis]|uniref:Uncharacterized protein n=1 Tax=Owenia fusiformis TaxID=6347 RepID=A0A8J1UUT3_OWEFU|nr:unnamed protein product [Owenia fusiformis]
MSTDSKTKVTCSSVAVFQISETVHIDVKKGDYSKPFLLLQERSWSSEFNTYGFNSVLLTVCQWNSLKNNFKNIQEFVTCVKSGQKSEMAMDLGERKLLKAIVKATTADDIAVLLRRVRSTPDSSGAMSACVTLSLQDFEKLQNWTYVVDSCIKDHSDVPIIDSISDPSQYKSPGLTKSSGLPPKLRPFKLKMPKAYSNSETQTTADASTQTVPPTPTEDLKDPFQTMMPTYSAFNGDGYGGGMPSPAGFNVDFSSVNINDYTPLATPEDFACGSSVDDYRPFGYYSPISPTM